MLEEDEAATAPTTEVWVLWHQESLIGFTRCPRKLDRLQCPAAPHIPTVTVSGKDKAFVWIHQGRGPGWRCLPLQAYLPTCHKLAAFLVRYTPLSKLICHHCDLEAEKSLWSLRDHGRTKHCGRSPRSRTRFILPMPKRLSSLQAILLSNEHERPGWWQLPWQAYLHSVHEIVASLVQAMPRSLCGLDTKTFWLSLKDHVRTKHHGRRPLHRTYNLSSPRRLSSFLAFLAYEIENVRSHPHFEELSQWATNKSIFWKGDRGQMMEKLVHLVINTHVAPCSEGKCMAFKLRVNFSGDWSAYTTESCHKCNPTDRLESQEVVSWHLEDFVTWVPWRYSPSLSAELVTLLLNPSACWRSQPSQSASGDPVRQSLTRGWGPPSPPDCNTCGKQLLQRKTYATGGPFFIMVAALYADICTCGFECVWGL